MSKTSSHKLDIPVERISSIHIYLIVNRISDCIMTSSCFLGQLGFNLGCYRMIHNFNVVAYTVYISSSDPHLCVLPMVSTLLKTECSLQQKNVHASTLLKSHVTITPDACSTRGSASSVDILGSASAD